MTLSRVVAIGNALVVAECAGARAGRARFAAVVRCLSAILSPCGAAGVRSICAIRGRCGPVLVLPAIGETGNDVIRIACVAQDEGAQVRTLEPEVGRASIGSSKVLTRYGIGIIFVTRIILALERITRRIGVLFGERILGCFDRRDVHRNAHAVHCAHVPIVQYLRRRR